MTLVTFPVNPSGSSKPPQPNEPKTMQVGSEELGSTQVRSAQSTELQPLDVTVRPMNATGYVGGTKQMTIEEEIDRPYEWVIKSGDADINTNGLVTIGSTVQAGDVIEVEVIGEGVQSTTGRITIRESD